MIQAAIRPEPGVALAPRHSTASGLKGAVSAQRLAA